MNFSRLLVIPIALGAGIWAYVSFSEGGSEEYLQGNSSQLQREPLQESSIAQGPTAEDMAFAKQAERGDGNRLAALDLNRRALAALDEKQTQKAVGLLRQALELSPEDVVIRLNLSRSLGRWAGQEVSLGRQDKALELLMESQEVDADQGTPAYSIARFYLRLGRRVEARKVLDDALAAFPNQPALLRLSADLAALEGNLKRAADEIQEALALMPEDAFLQERASQLLMEEQLYRTFLTDSTAHFESRFDPQDIDMVKWIPDLKRDLEEAYTEVVGLLGIQPQQRILVMWLDPEQYQWRAPDWSSGLYDGRVRIVIDDYPRDQTAIRSTLRHELTHAVLFTLGTRLPTWLQEGMAQIAEGHEVELARQGLRSRLPLRLGVGDLDSNWTAWTDYEQVAQAYFYSMAFCGWLEDEYGQGVLHNLFQNVRGHTFAEGWERTFGLDFDMVEARHRATWENL
ncbi:MAG: tetratricopeptide repeat protein [Planctomycetota bacterium]|nr:tetratricopeptide repeat protein [Planctomycetota bacterium]MDA1112719.1 tetratricopeptide repeat protein [Planctomycetota bacterium]